MWKSYNSATQVNIANYCTFRYYLRYMLEGNKPLRLSAYVKGSLLHSLLEHFWERLGTEEEALSKSKKFKDKKYFDAESFARYTQGKWKRIIIADEKKSGEKITWYYEAEKWTILNNLKRICMPLFDYKIKEPIPEKRFIEMPFSFVVGGRMFKGRMDEISLLNNKIRIMDYKSGNPWVGEMKLKHDPQLTLYAAGLCAKLRDDKEFARQFNLEGKIEEFMQGQSFISPNLEVGFFMIEALGIDPEKVRTVPDPVVLSNRTDNHLFEVLKMVDGTKKRCLEGNVHPERGKKCDICDMKYHCDKELENANKGLMIDRVGQLSLDFSIPDYIRREDYAKKVKMPKRDPLQKRMRFRYN